MDIESDFSPGLFFDPRRSSRDYARIHDEFIRSGSRHPVDQFSGALRERLLASPDPGMALTNLVRFSESAVSKASLFNDLVQYPVAFELLMRVFGYSQYFADILVREPGLFRWLTTSDVLMKTLSREDLSAEIGRLRTTFARPEARLEALKRLHRREMLRIGTQDLLATVDLAGVTQQLSDLADLIVSEVCEISSEQLRGKFGAGPGVPFAVIGLGKLGGAELNYSSDIDVMFVYERDGDFAVSAEGIADIHEYFVRLCERIVRNLAEPTAGGHLYRVDTRLRPDAGAGPLARSVTGYLTYYESRGELWERQMLLKARVVAGDSAFGESFLRQLEPFIYPRSALQHPAESSARIKARIETVIGEEANVKLMRGGIRDIEFIVQALQLLHAPRDRSVRERNTVRALAALAAGGYLGPEEATRLREAYVFYRTVEHRLQTVFNTQTHVIPTEARPRTALARRTGFPDAGGLLDRVAQHARVVRGIFEQVLAVPPAPGTVAAEEGMLAILDGGLPESAMHAVLSRYGFRDLRAAARHLRVLTTGSSMTELRELDSRTRAAFRTIAPWLFREIGQSPVPDITLAGLVAIVTAQKFPEQIYTEMQQPGFRNFLLQVCSHSPRFARLLAANPLLLDGFAADIGSLARKESYSITPGTDLVQFKQQQELRAGLRSIFGFSDFSGLTDDLSILADAIVGAVTTEELSSAALPAESIAVFALGKFGTRELTFDADLDLLFIAGLSGGPDRSKVERLAGSIVKRLTSVAGTGRLYDVDVRLRPEGKNAPLVVDGEGYRSYMATRASLWERQSLTRLRFVCGNAEVGERVQADVRDFVYGTPLPPNWVQSTVEMRRKTESRSRVRSDAFVDVKLGAGGMVDIEFLVQMLQLSTREPRLRNRKVEEILAAPDLPVPPGAERECLARAYATFRRIETVLRVTFDERVTILPEGETLERLARFMGHDRGSVFAGDIRETMKRVRSIFLSATAALAVGGGNLT